MAPIDKPSEESDSDWLDALEVSLGKAVLVRAVLMDAVFDTDAEAEAELLAEALSP